MNKRLLKKAKEIGEVLSKSKFVRCVSHNDADGLSAASIGCNSLIRENIPFHLSILENLNPDSVNEIIEEVNQRKNNAPENSSKGCADEETVVFFDMGSGQPSIIKKLEKTTVIIDHHPPLYKDEVADYHLNPHHFGVDGSSEISASGMSYIVAREMSRDNIDLAGQAIAGAIGDMQHRPFKGLNLEILNEGREKGYIEAKKGLKFYGTLKESLFESTEPYIKKISGNKIGVEKILDKISLNGESKYWELGEEKKRRLTNIIVLLLVEQGSDFNAISEIVGDICLLDKEVVSTASHLASLINACGKSKEYGLALSILLRKNRYLEDAEELQKDFKGSILKELKNLEEKIVDRKNIKYFVADNSSVKGSVAGISTSYLWPDKPMLGLVKKNNHINISARGNDSLIQRGLDLSSAMSESADKVGGRGGGHDIASGARIPSHALYEFIKAIDAKVGDQLGEEN